MNVKEEKEIGRIKDKKRDWYDYMYIIYMYVNIILKFFISRNVFMFIKFEGGGG